MIKPILELFSSSMLGRLIGLLRFQVILYVFGQNEFSDTIIYFTTFIWLVNNFFVIPNVNSSLIADLSSNEEENHPIIIINLIRKTIKVSLSSGFIALLVIFLVIGNNDILSLDVLSLVLIFLTFPLLGVNEIVSLYNQYKGRYFLYSFNPVIWNVILILCLVLYFILDIKIFYIYFLFLFFAKLTSLFIQYKFSYLNLHQTYKNRNLVTAKPSINIYYTISIIIFSGITFFDLTILGIYSFIGAVTVYSILLKIPTLLMSLISSSALPVFFNRIIMKEGSLFRNLINFSGLSFLLFMLLGFIYLFIGEYIFKYLFNYSLTNFDYLDIYLALIFMFVSSFAFFFIRLSVEFKFQKSIFVISFLGLIIKLVSTYLFTINIRNLMILNILALGLVSISGLYSIYIKQNIKRL